MSETPTPKPNAASGLLAQPAAWPADHLPAQQAAQAGSSNEAMAWKGLARRPSRYAPARAVRKNARQRLTSMLWRLWLDRTSPAISARPAIMKQIIAATR